MQELIHLEADIDIIVNAAIVKGGKALKGARIMSLDLRRSACLVIAAMAAEGNTELFRVYHLDRGYKDLEKKLNSLGANIIRV